MADDPIERSLYYAYSSPNSIFYKIAFFHNVATKILHPFKTALSNPGLRHRVARRAPGQAGFEAKPLFRRAYFEQSVPLFCRSPFPTPTRATIVYGFAT
jgi:hypothetical protein